MIYCMRAITLWQPWASLVAEGAKCVETRPRRNPWRFVIGQRVAVHAAMREPDPGDVGDWQVGRLDPGEPRRMWSTKTGEYAPPVELPLGAVVATALVADVVTSDQWIGWQGTPERLDGQQEPPENHGWLSAGPSWRWILVADEAPAPNLFIRADEQPLGNYDEGRWLVLFDDVVKLPEPVPMRGHQGLWRLTRDATALVEHLESKARAA